MNCSDEGDQQPDRLRPDVADQLLAGGLSTFTAVATSLLFGAQSAFASAAVGPFIQPLANELRDRISRNGQRVLRSAELSSGQSVEYLFEQVMKDPEKLLVVQLIVDAAIRTAMTEKLALLGKVLASVALEEHSATIEHEAIVVGVVAELEPPHVTVLQQIAQAEAAPNLDDRGISKSVLASSLHDSDPLKAILQPILGVLDRNRLAKQVAYGDSWEPERGLPSSTDSSNRWAMTTFGNELLRHFREAADQGNA